MSTARKDTVLTTDEAIEYLKISKPTFLKYVHLGRIKAIKAGKGWRILQSELNRFLRGEVAPANGDSGIIPQQVAGEEFV
jgi:excisionase family DNA binding protein